MLKQVGLVSAGLSAFALFEYVANQIAKASWLAYAVAAPTHAYEFDMLIVRLIAGALGIFLASVLITRAKPTARTVALLFGTSLLIFSVIWHIIIWSQYPVWYHLAWFACILPSAMIGGRVSGRVKTAQP
jgi:hypothetical protein